jgi:hypothetical protein
MYHIYRALLYDIRIGRGMWENHISCCTNRQPGFPMKNVTAHFYNHSVFPVCVKLLYKASIVSSLCFCMQAYLSLCESGFFIDLNCFLKL